MRSRLGLNQWRWAWVWDQLGSTNKGKIKPNTSNNQSKYVQRKQHTSPTGKDAQGLQGNAQKQVRHFSKGADADAQQRKAKIMDKTKWLLHPQVPVDVRFLGAGLTGGSALYIWSWLSQSKPQDNTHTETQEIKLEYVPPTDPITSSDKPTPTWSNESDIAVNILKVDNTSGSESEVEDPQPNLLQNEAEQESADASLTTSADSTPESESSSKEELAGAIAESLQNASGADSESKAEVDQESTSAAEEASEEVSEKDAKSVIKLLEDTLSGKVMHGLESQNSELSSHMDGKESTPSGGTQESGESTNNLQDMQEEGKISSTEDAKEAVVEIEQQREDVEIMEKTTAHLESHANEIMADESNDIATSSTPDPVDIDSRNLVKNESADQIVGDLTSFEPGELVARVLSSGEGPGENWELYGAMHKQAVSDAHLFKEKLLNITKSFEGKVEKLKDAINTLESQNVKLKDSMRIEEKKHLRNIQKTLAMADELRQDALQRQSNEILRSTAEALVRERGIRLGQLDEIRGKANALEMAFSKKSNEVKLSHDVHKLALSVFTIQSRTTDGLPFHDALVSLTVGFEDDGFVNLLVSSIPEGVAKNGVKTHAQLQQWFDEMEKGAAKVALVPKEGGGLLSYSLSHVASMLRVKETHPDLSCTSHNLEATLCRARQLLMQGKIFQCAQLLEDKLSGTAASSVSSKWIQAARDRALVDQAVTALVALATSKASSLA